MFKKIILDKDGGVAVIRFNRPEVMNAFDLETQEELTMAINDVQRDENIKVLIITGKGKAFCAGVDITVIEGMSIEQVKKFLKNAQQMILALVNMEKPVIAAINGYASGGGCNIALASDIIIASENAKFSQGFVKIGLISDMGGMYFLPRLVGLGRAKELMFLGETIDAREALKIGMVNQVVQAENLERTAMELGRKMAVMSLKPIGLMKKILNQSTCLDLPSLLELEIHAQEVCSQTDDHKKIVQTFLSKKKKD